MSVLYNSEVDAWIDLDDFDFRVKMTSNCPVEESELEFETQEDFWKWYMV